MNKLIIGNLETIHLPDLGIRDLQVRIDTGAQSSSLHVDNLKRIQRSGRPWVCFDLHPDLYNTDDIVRCESPVHDIRRIKSSNGESQQRYVIRTTIDLGGQTWPIDITLSNRSDMTYLMLLGREGMGNRVLVDPSATFVTTPGSVEN
ncbi:ATP-dependent zinc protease [Teredinibacter turnerae]|uniref:ATP-dependent zinc protease family protein n=1 Tax=Teredinibacter turnerae TaxID=2426 RepID=UPI00037CC975|nr:ATP-dependent zinc protease [Teredinibacter turnerae]